MNYDHMAFEDISSLNSDQFSMASDYFTNPPDDTRGDESPDSSNSSSPKQIVGNRARAFSLNLKSPHGRSTAHITQQQINKKRQRATPEQLTVLEEAFGMNPSPNAKMREQISTDINMTERSVQIWFQNRRAKTKLLHRKGGFEETGFYQMPYGFRPGMPARSYSIDQGVPNEYLGEHNASSRHLSSKTVITRLNCRSLTIGSWRRVSCTAMDLVCYFAQDEPKFTYYINSGAAGFKIEFAIGSIGKIDLRYFSADGPKELGRALVTLVAAPLFFMEAPVAGGWKQCSDFTENQQATKEMTHAIVGPYNHLKTSLTELASIHTETTNIMTFEDIQTAPNQMMGMTFGQPIAALPPQQQQRSMAYTSGFVTPDPRPRPTPSSASTLDIPTQAPRNMHRRTRSRSAPIAVDFSQMVSHNNVGGMPGYSFGQQSLRVDPNYHYNPGAQSNSSSATPYEFTEPLPPTPISAMDPNYHQDPWYSASYAGTPLLDGPQSALASPMVPNTSQFDLGTTGLQGSYANGFNAHTQQPNDLPSTLLNGQHMMPNHSMPDLQHMAGAQDLTQMNQAFGAVDDSMQASHLATPLAYPSIAPLSIEDMDFADLQNTSMTDHDQMMAG